MIKGRDGTESNTIIPERKRKPHCYLRERLGKVREDKTISSKAMDQPYILSLPNSLPLAWETTEPLPCGSPELSPNPLSRLQMCQCPYSVTWGKPKYGFMVVNMTTYMVFLNICQSPAINHSVPKWNQSRTTFVFQGMNGKPESNTKVV